ncbi:MAG: ABC transporter substrate-binding protein [Rhodospirillaceae bacterium]|nr:ABC transporter substrate-binding protein [Rhodospirillaceae bacterium]
MTSWKFSIAAVAAVALAASAASADSIKIGFNTPQTGFAAADGKSVLTGAQIAIDTVNAAGGVNGKKLELIVYDDQAKPKFAVPIATKLIQQDKVAMSISGSYSAPTRASAGVYQNAKVPYISAFAVHPDITRAGNYIFRTGILGSVLGRAAAKLVGDKLGKKRVVITIMKNDYGKALAAGFKSVMANYGIKVVNEYQYSLRDRQFGPIVSSIKGDNPDAIFDTGYWFVAAPFVSQLRAGGVTAVVVAQEGYDGVKFIEIAKKAAEGVIIVTALDRDSKEPAVVDFMTEFKKRAGYGADMVGASGHAAVMVAAAALKKAGSTDRAAIRDALASIKVDAITGTLSFNKLGEVQKSLKVQEVRGGGWHYHSEITDAKLLTPPEK